MGEIKRFEDLNVWQKSHELVLEVYKVTQYHLLLAKDLKYLSEIKYQALFNLSKELGRMLNGLIKPLSNLKPQT
jgi:hypothetical protein